MMTNIITIIHRGSSFPHLERTTFEDFRAAPAEGWETKYVMGVKGAAWGFWGRGCVRMPLRPYALKRWARVVLGWQGAAWGFWGQDRLRTGGRVCMRHRVSKNGRHSSQLISQAKGVPEKKPQILRQRAVDKL